MAQSAPRQVFLASCLFAASSAFGGHITGNAGDPLNLVFEKARVDAAMAAQNWDPAVLRDVNIFACADVRADDCPSRTVADYLLTQEPAVGNPARTVARHKNLAIDLLAVDMDFRAPEGQDSCALTNVPGHGNTIFLDYDRCRAELNAEAQRDSAVRLLLHESAHHFGVGGTPKDEQFATQIADVIYETWRRQEAAKSERWQSLILRGRPAPRYQQAAAWIPGVGTGGAFFVWGGCHVNKLADRELCSQYLGDGGLYAFAGQNESWTALPAAEGAPSPRTLPGVAVADAEGKTPRVFLWGGYRHLEKPYATADGDKECQAYGTLGRAARGDNLACTVTLRSGAVLDVATGKWRAMSDAGAPRGRVRHSMVWTGDTGDRESGRRLVVWGGQADYQDLAKEGEALADGAVYAPEANGGQGAWQSLAPAPVAARFGHTTIYTGANADPALAHRMIVWGGCDQVRVGWCNEYFADGAVYDVVAKRWESIPPSPELEGRTGHTAVWTGSHMIVFGGRNRAGVLATGAAFDPKTMSWEPLPTLFPPGAEARAQHVAAWTPTGMVVWGGVNREGKFLRDGMVINPFAGRGEWRAVASDTTPLGRKEAAAAWTGESLLVWGGYGENQTYLGDGARLFVGRP